MSILKRAKESGLVNFSLVDIRDFSEDKHNTVDDRPYGGGPGMVLKPEPLIRAIRSAKSEKSHVVYLSPQGKTLNAKKCKELSLKEDIVFVCGHYEGIDQRVIDLEIDEEISIGDYVLTSGAPAAAVVIDSVVRFIPGAIGHEDSNKEDSFEEGIFDTAHYTRPEEFEGLKVPEVLLQGNHGKIRSWRRENALKKTSEVRPDLVEEYQKK